MRMGGHQRAGEEPGRPSRWGIVPAGNGGLGVSRHKCPCQAADGRERPKWAGPAQHCSLRQAARGLPDGG